MCLLKFNKKDAKELLRLLNKYERTFNDSGYFGLKFVATLRNELEYLIKLERFVNHG